MAEHRSSFTRRPRPRNLRVMLAAARILLLLILLGLLVDFALTQATKQRRSPRPFTDPIAVVHNTALPFLGVTVELEQYATQAERRAALQTLRDANFRWVRQRVDWALVEPQPGRFDWAQSDALLRDILAADLVPLVVLDGSPAWARAPRDADNPFAPPQHPQPFANFVAAFAARYRAQIQFYQLWDEPNIAPHWGNRRPDPVAYAQMLSLASPALRAADPDVGGPTVIALAALAPTADRGHTALDEPYFLQRLYAAGAAPHFDAVAVQPFGFGTRAGETRLDAAALNLRRTDLVRRTMVAAGDGATPVWAVRYGWSRAPASARFGAAFGTVSAQNQRDFATAALDFAAARPWLTAMGWAVDQPAAPSDPRWGFALTNELRAEFASWSPPSRGLPDAPGRALPMGFSKAGWSEDALHSDVFGTGRSAAGSTGAWLLATLVLLVVALQRTTAAARVLPWQTIHRRYGAAPVWVRATAWLALLAIYHLATWPPLIVLCWGLAALGVAAQPLLGLALAAATLPFHIWHKELSLPGATVAVAPSQAALGCLAAALVFRCVRWRFFTPWAWNLGAGRSTNRRHIPSLFELCTTDWLALAWLVVGLLGSLTRWHAPAYREGLLDLVLAPLGLYAATRLLVRTPKARRQLGGALLLGGVLTAAVGLWSWSRGGGEAVDGVRRLMGPHFSPNHTALYLERTLWLGAGLWLAARCRCRWLVGGGVVLAAAALALTASRGALLLGVPAGCLLLGMLGWFTGRRTPNDVQALLNWASGWQRWRRRTALTAGMAAGIAAAVGATALLSDATPLPLPLAQRLFNSATLLDRLAIWRATLSLWGTGPLLGTGAGGFAWRYPAFLPVQPLDGPLDGALLHPHNVWLEFASIHGAVGLAWLLALLLVVARHARRAAAQRDWLALGLVAALGAGLAHAQVDAFAALADLAGWLWIALALLRPAPSGAWHYCASPAGTSCGKRPDRAASAASRPAASPSGTALPVTR